MCIRDRLLVEVVRHKGLVTARPTRVLVEIPPDQQLGRRAKTLRTAAQELCQALEVNRAIVTDGLRWSGCEARRAGMLPPVRLDEAIDDADAFDGFLYVASAED